MGGGKERERDDVGLIGEKERERNTVRERSEFTHGGSSCVYW